MSGLGKTRSKYGRFMDVCGVKQEDVRRATGFNKDTVSKAFNEKNPKFRKITKQEFVKAARKLTGEIVQESDFWN